MPIIYQKLGLVIKVTALMSSQSDSLRDHKDTNEQVFNYQFKMPLGVWTSDTTKKTGQGGWSSRHLI